MFSARRFISHALVLALVMSLHMILASSLVRAQSEVIVELTMPATSQTVVGATEVRGTVIGPEFSRYDLHYRPVGLESDYIFFGGGQNPVESGVLGYWSGLNLELGDYEIRLKGYFGDQHVYEASVRFALADKENVGELESVGNVGPATRTGSQSELRASLDNLAIKARPESLWSYLGRGAQLGATAGGFALSYFVVKALILWSLRRTRKGGE